MTQSVGGGLKSLFLGNSLQFSKMWRSKSPPRALSLEHGWSFSRTISFIESGLMQLVRGSKSKLFNY